MSRRGDGMRLVIDISEYDKEWISNAYGIPQDINTKIAEAIINAESIQPKRGKWNRLDMDTLNCNKCGATFVLNQGSEKMHFCPNCGTDMRGDGMDDLISRQAAIDGKICIRRSNGVEIYDDYAVPVEYLEQLPPAQPGHIRGRWIQKSQVPDTVRGYWATCSSCGRGSFGGGNFCRECGSDNREVTT